MLRKVLIVEDSALQAKMYNTIFWKYQDCELIFASNGIEAMDRLSIENNIDLIVTDINMPKMNGLLFLETMIKEGYSNIPVIVISTIDKDDEIRHALALGARGYVKKPWSPVNLWELINKVANLN